MNSVSVAVPSTTSPCWGILAANDAPTGLGVAGVKTAVLTNRGTLHETSNYRIAWEICHRGSGGFEDRVARVQGTVPPPHQSNKSQIGFG